jgi:hypothetical protein
MGKCKEALKTVTFLAAILSLNGAPLYALEALDLPFPPDQLIKMMKQYAPDGEVHGVIIPDGRSPEKPETDLLQPRTLLGISGHSKTGAFVSLFVGYVPKTNKLQIIRWNPETQKNEFFIVENYGAGLTPKISSPQTSCVGCHQNNGPIFSVDPWREVLNPNSSERPDDLETLRKNPKADPFVKYLLSSKEVDLDPESFDGLVSGSNETMLSKKVCNSACGDDVNCRRAVVAAAVFPATLPMQPETPECIKARTPTANQYVVAEICGRPALQYQEFRKNFLSSLAFDGSFGNYPESGVGFPADTLPDRNPFDKSDDKKPELDPSLARTVGNDLHGEHGYTIRRSLVQKKDVAKYLNENATECFDFDQSQFKKIPRDQITAAIRSQSFGLILKENWPISPEKLLSFLMHPAADGSSDSCLNCPCRQIPAAIPPEIKDLNEGVNTALKYIEPLPKDATPIQLFKFYCTECHLSGPRPLPFDNTSQLSQYPGKNGRTVNYMLSNHLMPQVGSPQPTSDQFKEMLKALNTSTQ